MGHASSSSTPQLLQDRAARVAEWPEWNVGSFRIFKLLALRSLVASLTRIPTYMQSGCLSAAAAAAAGGASAPSTSITSIPSCGITISTPGTYVLKNSISWTPASGNLAAIRIVCSDVTVDLGNNVLSKSRASRFANCAGIVAVAPTRAPLIGVSICCGFVRHFDVYGVAAIGADGVRIERVVVQNLQNKDMAVNSVGIFVAGCDGADVTWCACEQVTVSSIAHSAIQARFCNGVNVSDCRVQSQLNASGGCTGISAGCCADVTLLRNTVGGIHVGEIIAPHSVGQTALGLFPMCCVRVAIEDCHVSRVTGSCDDAHGVSVFICPKTVKVVGCTFDQINTGFRSATRSGAKVTGVEVMLSTYVLVQKCVATNITGSAPQDGQVAGFTSGGTSRVTFSACTARQISCGDTAGSGVGFGWAPDPRKIFIQLAEDTVFKSCVAEDCDVAYDLFMHKNAVVMSCTAKNVRRLLLFNDSTQSRTLTCNACSECPSGKRTVVRNKGSGNRGKPTEVF